MQRPEENRTGENRWPRSGKNSGGCRAGRPSRCAVLTPIPLSKDRRSNLWPIKHVCTTGTERTPSAETTRRRRTIGPCRSNRPRLPATKSPAQERAGSGQMCVLAHGNCTNRRAHADPSATCTCRGVDPSAGEELKRTTNPKGFAGQRNARHVEELEPTPPAAALR